MAAVNLLVWHWGQEAGSTKYAVELVRHLRDLTDYNLIVSCARNSEFHQLSRENFPGLPIEPISTYVGSKHSLLGRVSAAAAFACLPLLTAHFRKIVKRYHVDVALCAQGAVWDAATYPVFAKGWMRNLIIAHEISLPTGDSYVLRDRITARQLAGADGVIALAENMQQRLIDEVGVPSHRVWKTHHGTFTFGPDSPTRPAQHPQRSRPLRILFLGRIIRYKGLDRLLAAVNILQRNKVAVELIIAGAGDMTPYQNELGTDIELHNRRLSDEEIGRFLAKCDIVAVPYDQSSQSGVVVAAFTAGRPVVATPVSGLTEQVHDGVNGVVATDLTVAAYADALLRLCADANLFDQCAVGAYKYAQNELGWTASIRTIQHAIQQVQIMPRRCDRVATTEGLMSNA